ncbi:DegV family protein [Thalassobacillus pellis]|uniref:DegV family protein n=1 Tax=Thalassobacillus pellis TaxID=748008 RepID=UPI00195FC52D|nr:DegV family protein [Thalassobacillus pellis]MBM7551440.1 DegV family protein with EDD domain [Thalassobacillus pellis]
MKTAVLTDSTAYIPSYMREQNNIHMVPLNVIFQNEAYREEIDIQAEDFYDMLHTQDELPKTSQPSTGLVTEKIEELARDFDAVVAIHLSSGISGTYQGTITAGNMVDDVEVHVFDSESSCFVQGFYVLEAAEMANNGATPQQILARLEEMKKSINAYFMVDDLTNLYKGGRLSGAQKIVGSLLQVKPVLHFVDKKIVPFEKIRTRKKALKRLLLLFEEDVDETDVVKATVIHGNCHEDAEGIKKELESRYPNTEVVISYFGPVIGTHVGEGAIGLGWYKK